MTAADDYLKAAKSAQAKMARGRKTTAEGADEFAAALYGMAEVGLSVAQIARDVKMSESHVRQTIKIETLRREKTPAEQPTA